MTKPNLTHELAQTIRAAVTRNTDAAERRDPNVVAAETARAFLASKVDDYEGALIRACVGRAHPGSQSPSEYKPHGVACPRCAVRVRSVRDVSALIAPDRAV